MTLTLAASCGVEAGENFPPSFVYTENLQERERERRKICYANLDIFFDLIFEERESDRLTDKA